MATVRCVVCAAPAPEEHYANAWERTRKRFPCCSPDCARRFDPDLHWIPGRLPEPADDEEVARLVRVGRQRIAGGDRPLLVVRELLVAGVPVVRVRGLVIELGSRADAEAATARRATIGSMVASAFTLLAGFVVFWRPRRSGSRLAAPGEADAAYGALDEWRRVTGEPADAAVSSAGTIADDDAASLPRATARDRRDG